MLENNQPAITSLHYDPKELGVVACKTPHAFHNYNGRQFPACFYMVVVNLDHIIIQRTAYHHERYIALFQKFYPFIVDDCLRNQVECIICTDDRICHSVLEKLERDRVRIPDQMKSFKNSIPSSSTSVLPRIIPSTLRFLTTLFNWENDPRPPPAVHRKRYIYCRNPGFRYCFSKWTPHNPISRFPHA